MIKILLILYIMGVICGIVGNLIICLETINYIGEKSKKNLIKKTDKASLVAGHIKTIVRILIPIYNYLILISALITPKKKLIEAVDRAIEK